MGLTDILQSRIVSIFLADICVVSESPAKHDHSVSSVPKYWAVCHAINLLLEYNLYRPT